MTNEDWQVLAAKRKAEKDEATKKVAEILASHGIRMSIGGCGCCNSPWVQFEYKGQNITESEGLSTMDDFNLDMFKEEKK